MHRGECKGVWQGKINIQKKNSKWEILVIVSNRKRQSSNILHYWKCDVGNYYKIMRNRNYDKQSN